jgi:hypothetical protein
MQSESTIYSESKILQQYGHVKYRKDGAGEENVDKQQ